MKRRQFLGALGGAVAAWPLAASAQPRERVRRVGVLMATTSDEPDSQARIAALHQGLQAAGWTIGGNVRVDVRWSGGNIALLRKHAVDLVENGSDVIVAGVGPTGPALRAATRTVPVVFAQVVDPVGNGYVASLSRPGGNATGFTQFEYSLSGKWLELLRELVPRISRVGVFRDAEGGPAGIGQWAVIQAFASPLGIELSPLDLVQGSDPDRIVSAFAGAPNSGIIVAVASLATIHRKSIVRLAAQHQLPAIYPYRFFVEDGGLLAYGPNLLDGYRRAAGYVDRILKGEKPADLPVQAPTKYELSVNLKTAKTLGLTVPPAFLARADEVIE